MATNEFGLDAHYFGERLARVTRDIDRFRPEELARELIRAALTANPEALGEAEFSSQPPLAGQLEPPAVTSGELTVVAEVEAFRALDPDSSVYLRSLTDDLAAGDFLVRHADAEALLAARDQQLASVKAAAAEEVARLTQQVLALQDELAPFAAMANGKDGWSDQDSPCGTFPTLLQVRKARAGLLAAKAQLGLCDADAEPLELDSPKPVIWLELDPSAAGLSQPPASWWAICSSQLYYVEPPKNRGANPIFPLYASPPATFLAKLERFRQTALSFAARNIVLAAEVRRLSDSNPQQQSSKG